MALAHGIRSGDRRALARLMSKVERDAPDAAQALASLHDLLGRAHVVGITGPPGAGKSTLILRLTQELRARGQTVGVLAVDPSSPVSGGSVLGDRIRLQDLHNDPGVFIRSIANAGMSGGLATRALELVDLLDAYGANVILLETVGVGQGETDVARFVDTNIVVSVPGLGDAIQTLKAGVLETGDIFVVNKNDRPDASETIATLRAMIEIGPVSAFRPEVLGVSALQNDGVEALIDAILAHRSRLEALGRWTERRAVRDLERVRMLAAGILTRALDDSLASPSIRALLRDSSSSTSAKLAETLYAVCDLLRRQSIELKADSGSSSELPPRS